MVTGNHLEKMVWSNAEHQRHNSSKALSSKSPSLRECTNDKWEFPVLTSIACQIILQIHLYCPVTIGMLLAGGDRGPPMKLDDHTECAYYGGHPALISLCQRWTPQPQTSPTPHSEPQIKWALSSIWNPPSKITHLTSPRIEGNCRKGFVRKER